MQRTAIPSLVATFSVPLRYQTSSNNRCEFEFLLQHKNLVIPIEVKADTNISSSAFNAIQRLHENAFSLRVIVFFLSLSRGIPRLGTITSANRKRISQVVQGSVIPFLHSMKTDALHFHPEQGEGAHKGVVLPFLWEFCLFIYFMQYLWVFKPIISDSALI